MEPDNTVTKILTKVLVKCMKNDKCFPEGNDQFHHFQAQIVKIKALYT